MNNELIKERMQPHKYKTDIDLDNTMYLSFYEGGAYPSEYLDMYDAKENEASYNSRINRVRTKYFNEVDRIVESWHNGIYESGDTEITRQFEGSTILSKYMNAIGKAEWMPEQMQTGLGAFIKDVVSRKALVLNQIFILVDMPEKKDLNNRTKQDDIDEKIIPYPTYILPNNVQNYKDNEFITIIDGQYDYQMGSEIVKKNQYKIWDANEWVLIKEQNEGAFEITDSGVHNLGQVPFIRFRFNDSMLKNETVGLSEVRNIVGLAQWQYELISMLDTNILAHVFVMLIGGKKTVEWISENGVGAFNLIPEDPEDNTRRLDVGTNAIQFLKDLIFTDIPQKMDYIGRVKDRSASGKSQIESGIAKIMDTVPEVINLRKKAKSFQDLEIQIMQLMSKWMDINPDGIDIKYPVSFELQSPAEILEEMNKLFELDMGSVKFNQSSAMRYIRSRLGNINTKLLKAITEEIEATDPALNIEDVIKLKLEGAISKKDLINRYNVEKVANEKQANKRIEENKDNGKKLDLIQQDVKLEKELKDDIEN